MTGNITTTSGNISLTSGSYRNGGFFVARSGKFRSGSGTGVFGYFIDPADYSNSLMICAFSHDSTTYQVWNGRISVNKMELLLIALIFTPLILCMLIIL